jgi:hypothetical protein
MKINWSDVLTTAIAVLLAMVVLEFVKAMFLDEAVAKVANKE